MVWPLLCPRRSLVYSQRSAALPHTATCGGLHACPMSCPKKSVSTACAAPSWVHSWVFLGRGKGAPSLQSTTHLPPLLPAPPLLAHAATAHQQCGCGMVVRRHYSALLSCLQLARACEAAGRGHGRLHGWGASSGTVVLGRGRYHSVPMPGPPPVWQPAPNFKHVLCLDLAGPRQHAVLGHEAKTVCGVVPNEQLHMGTTRRGCRRLAAGSLKCSRLQRAKQARECASLTATARQTPLSKHAPPPPRSSATCQPARHAAPPAAPR